MTAFFCGGAVRKPAMNSLTSCGAAAFRSKLRGACTQSRMVLVAVALWRFTPSSLVPDEDQGFYIAAVILPDGSSLQRTDKVVNEVVGILKSNPNNEDVVAFTGFDFLGGGFRNNAATIFVTQIPWDKRKGVTTPQLVGEFFMAVHLLAPAGRGRGSATSRS